MRNFKTYLFRWVALLFALWPSLIYAQDPHFTQQQRVPTFYNPAAAGQGVENIRLTMLYRNQWASIGSPFKTSALFFDKQVSHVGLGASIVNNSAGPSGIRQLQMEGTLSYRAIVGKHQLAGGLQIGLVQKSFDPSKMTFDDQYTPDQGFDPNNPTAESFSYTKTTRPDFGAGFLWSYGVKNNGAYFPYAGVSLQHINQPKESFIETNNTLPRKLVAQAGVGIHISENLQLTPMIMYMKQQFSKETTAGIIVGFPLQNRDRFETGVYYRSSDAVAVYTGYQWNSLLMGVSYDVNTSGLTGGPGALELTLTYIPKAKQKGPIIKKKEQDEDDTEVKEKKAPVKAIAKPKVAPSSRAAADKYATGSATTNSVTKPVPSMKDARDKPVVVPVPVKTTPAPVVTIPVPERSFEPMEPTAPPALSCNVRDPMRKVSPSRTTIGSRIVTIPLSTDTIDDPLLLGTIHSAIPEQLIQQEEALPISNVVVAERTTALKEVVEYEQGPEEILSRPMESDKLLSENTSDKAVRTTVPKRISHIAAEPIPVAAADMIPSTMHKLNAAKVKSSYKKDKPVKTGIPVRNHVLGNYEEEMLPVAVKQVQKVSDADQDGVPDAVDECPYIKGSVATHGCPDTDGDGVIDKDDHCPLEIGVKENNGCPAVNSLLIEGVNIQFGNIEFGTGSAEVKGIYKLDIIEPALDSLWDNANYTLVLTGHTDNEGDAAFNMKLSQDRADVVKALFIKKGLDESRIRTVAYGETVPLRENTSEEGKLHNRRVEVHVIKIKKQ